MERLIVILLSSFFSAVNTYSQQQDKFVKLNSSKIHYHQKGEGKPAIVFVSGLGEDHKGWQLVQDSISRFARTLSYDRAGLGKSEYHEEQKDLTSLARELNELITSVKLQSSFILVGHSLGCQIIKKYASLYPGKINGIIFLDPGYDERKLQERLADSVWQKREETLKKYLPPFNAAQKAELDQLNTNCSLADQITRLPKIPIVLFTATRINPNFPGSSMELRVKQETHRAWLQSLPWANHVEVKESRHYVQADKPGLVIETVYKMIKRSN
jgi:pimeloyl-ACP methyl ester carboxylesterase